MKKSEILAILSQYNDEDSIHFAGSEGLICRIVDVEKEKNTVLFILQDT